MALDSLLNSFVSACLDVFGRDQVEGIVLHGSAHKGGSIPGYSDVDFMVFLAADCFDSQGDLSDECVFAIQERIGPLPWRAAGFRYPQAMFYDARRLPPWWTGPVPGSYRMLWGQLPVQARATAEGLRAASRRFLTEDMPRQVAGILRNFADADDPTLARRLRILGTVVTPSVFALAALNTDEVLELWAKPKFEVLASLEACHADDEGPALARRFYEQVTRLYSNEFDANMGRQTFRLGIRFLRWVQRAALETPR